MHSRYLRATALASVLALGGLVPAGANAQGAHHSRLPFRGPHSITIHAQPNPIVVGDSVVVYGRLLGRDSENKLVVLYHHATGSPFGFVPVQATRTGVGGAYEFQRADGSVDSNRQWYVAADGAVSAVVNERVAAQVTVNVTGPNGQSEPDGSVLFTGRGYVYTFAGSDDPGKPGAPVLLQRQAASAGPADWVTIGRGTLDANGSYSIAHVFVIPSSSGGDANVRILVPNDVRNIASPSESLSYEIEQTQNQALTIVPGAYSIDEGQSDTIAGVDAQGSGKELTLWAHLAGQSWAKLATTMTTVGGAYTFSVFPTYNTYYRVDADAGIVTRPLAKRTTAGTPATGMSGTTGSSGSTGTSGSSGDTGTSGSTGTSGTTGRGGVPNLAVSAVAFVGVRVVMTVQTTPTTISQGQSVTFSGTFNPDETGRTFYLERLNASGEQWHILASGTVGQSSQYTLTEKFYVPGTETVRVAIPGSPANQGTATAPIGVTVNPIPATTLVPAAG
ncbi:MAG: hypothetical protein ABSC56_11435 [Solirubrobacteraceae bacterium]|jgi:hypothetical protein